MPSGRFTRTAKVGGSTPTWDAECIASGTPATDTGRRSMACCSAAVTSAVGIRRRASAAATSTAPSSSRSPSPRVAEVKQTVA